MTKSDPGRWQSVGTYRWNRPLNVRGRARVTAAIYLCGRDQTWSNGRGEKLSLPSTDSIKAQRGQGRSSSMSRILDSMPQSTVVSYSQMVQQLSQESSEKAHDSQVTVILSLWLKQVIASFIAQQLHLLSPPT